MSSDYADTFDQLDQLIVDLPPDHRAEMCQLAERARERRDLLQASLDDYKDSMTDLRLRLQYLAFDREATARESTAREST